MSYSQFYTDHRVRSFQRRKGISQENRFQAVVVAILVVLTPIIVWGYVSGQRDLTSARVQYVSQVEAQ